MEIKMEEISSLMEDLSSQPQACVKITLGKVEEEKGCEESPHLLLQTKYTRSEKTLPALHKRLLEIDDNSELKFETADASKEEINKDSDEYKKLKNTVKSSLQKQMKVTNIQRVRNLFSYFFYILKREEYTILYGKGEFKERTLFHGTDSKAADLIIKENFDWRLYGESNGYDFGQGVYFSPYSTYAAHYCEKNEPTRIMIMAKVLQSNTCVGYKEMIFPPELPDTIGFHYDTSSKLIGDVIVKYCDDEFYPTHLVTFTGFPRKY